MLCLASCLFDAFGDLLQHLGVFCQLALKVEDGDNITCDLHIARLATAAELGAQPFDPGADAAHATIDGGCSGWVNIENAVDAHLKVTAVHGSCMGNLLYQVGGLESAGQGNNSFFAGIAHCMCCGVCAVVWIGRGGTFKVRLCEWYL